jgi:non-specific serine/threonine protein kinase
MSFRNSLNKKFTHLLNEIVNSNIQNERFGVSELAYELNMSRSNLHRKIKAATGDSVSQYLRKVRLKKAMELLKEQPYTVSEVAFAVGFASVNYFSKCFKDYFGYPPSDVEYALEGYEYSPTLKDHKNVLKNFPVQTTSFIGRQTEINSILGLVKEHRIVSLVGTGGCGKTRLACEMVSRIENEYRDGIWFVNLASVETEKLVTKQLLTTLEIAEVPGKGMMEVLTERIREKNLLILLDNCEHLLSTCSKLVGELVQLAPDLSVLATSREALNIKGEKVWHISPLSLVEPASVVDVNYASKSEAVRLFTDRAQLNNPGFKLASENVSEVVTACQKVDGIPLAVELLAGRIRYMDIHTIIDRFGGRLAEIPSMDPGTSNRHKTLQATIEWSYNLLTEKEQTLFRRLSVFSGGFDLTALEEVCANEFMSKEEILDVFPRLIDTSMVKTDYTESRKMRYTLLETLHQYGKILLKKRENEEISRKHLEYFSVIAEQAYDERMSSQANWMDRIRLEHNNCLVALNWAEQHDPEKFQRLAANLSWFWGRMNNYSMAIEILERVIASKPEDKETQARLNTGYGSLLFTTAEFNKAAQLLKDGVSLWQELKNKKEEALTLSTLADLTHGMGDDETGMKYSKEGYDLAAKLNDPGVELQCMIVVVYGLVATKKTQQGRPLIKKALKMAEDLDNLYLIVVSHHMLGDCDLMEGKYHDSEKEYGLSLKATLKYGDKSYTCMEMVGLAMSVSGQGRLNKALRLNAAVNKAALSFGYWKPEEVPQLFCQDLIKQHIVGARQKLGEELTNKTEEEGRAMSLDEAVEYALDFERD